MESQVKNALKAFAAWVAADGWDNHEYSVLWDQMRSLADAAGLVWAELIDDAAHAEIEKQRPNE